MTWLKISPGQSNLCLVSRPLTSEQLEFHTQSLAITCEHFHVFSLIQSGNELMSCREMLLRNDAEMWKDAEREELVSLERTGCFEWVPVGKVPNSTKLLTNKMVYKLKPDQYKAHCVICGFAQDMADVGYTFAPVCCMETVRALLNCANANRWSLLSLIHI